MLGDPRAPQIFTKQPMSFQLGSKTLQRVGSSRKEWPAEGKEYRLPPELPLSLGCSVDHKASTGPVGMTGPLRAGPCEPSPHQCTLTDQLQCVALGKLKSDYKIQIIYGHLHNKLSKI